MLQKTVKCKTFDIVLELEIQAVTCPGVWLCPNGKISIQVYLLGLRTQTSMMNPVFPLLYHEKFVFRKNFAKIQNLYELDYNLRKEVVYVELIQWEDCENGNVLATFKTSLNELLYPFPNRKGMIAGVDVDLLMEATKKFPGIIAPKIEVSSKVTIEEVLCSVKHDKKNDLIVVNPKLISSKCVPKRNTQLRQKKVCHTYKYHKAKSKQEPNIKQYCYSPPTSSMSSPKSPGKLCPCNHEYSLDKDFVHEKVKKLRKCEYLDSPCECNNGNKKLFCPLCTKYKYYFFNPCGCSFAQDNGLLCKCLQNEYDCLKYSVNKPKQQKENLCKCNKKLKASSIERNKTKTYLTEEIHDRLQKALSTPTCVSLYARNNMCEEESCSGKFYKNLEQFYKQLYMRAHYKVKNEKCKCQY